MAWDDDKSTAQNPDSPDPDEQLSADEWDSHVSEGHFPASEVNFGVDSGDPVVTDPQNADEIIARYDRSSGSWIFTSIGNDDYHESVVSGSVSGTTGLDLSSSNFFRHTLTGNATFTFDNPSSSPAGNSFTIIVQQDGTGGHTITWPSSVEWSNGSSPTLSTNANDKHMLSFVSPDGGTTWIGVVSATVIG